MEQKTTLRRVNDCILRCISSAYMHLNPIMSTTNRLTLPALIRNEPENLRASHVRQSQVCYRVVQENDHY